MSIIADSIRSFINAKQKDNESLHDSTRRFKPCRDIMESQLGGPMIIEKYIQTLPEYDTLKKRLNDQEKLSAQESKIQLQEEIELEYDKESKTQDSEIQQETNKQKRYLIKKAAKKLYAFIYLENSNQTKYGTIIKTLNQQKAFGNDQFPNTIVKASEILSNHNYEN